jgi:thioredoxin-like negative regulator of GroEL
MNEQQFRDVHARVVQFADNIYNQAQARTSDDHVRAGLALLTSGSYAEAARCFTEAVTEEPRYAEAHFGLALALLQGRRPHRHGEATLRRVEGHLRAADGLVEARVLELLVAEDHRLAWQQASRQIPPHVTALARELSVERAHLILTHVPAPEARTWRAIEQAVER